MKLVPLKKVFDVKYGVNLELNKLEFSSEGINFVSRTSKNNGVSAKVSIINDLKPIQAGVLTVAGGGSVLETFLQSEPFYSGRDLYFLKPLYNLSNVDKLIYCSFIRANKYRYNFGRQANKTLREILIPHPSEVKVISKNLTIPNEPAYTSLIPDKENLKDKKWEWFKYSELFDIGRGFGPRKKDLEKGKTPFITSTEFSNGLTALISTNPTHKGNVISVTRNGSVGEAFYQDIGFCSTEDVHIFTPKFNLNVFIAMFLSTLIRKEKYRYNYGRKWGIARMNKSEIKLPVTDSGKPDWNFMENYIKSLGRLNSEMHNL